MDQDLFREAAARCRHLRSLAALPQVRDELTKLAAEFEAIARKMDSAPAFLDESERETPIVS